MNLRNSYSPALLGLATIAASAQFAQAQTRFTTGSVTHATNPTASITHNYGAFGSWNAPDINLSWSGGPTSSQAFADQNSVITFGPNGFSASGSGIARAFTGTSTPSQAASAQSLLGFNINVAATTQVAYSYTLMHGANSASYPAYQSQVQIGSFSAVQNTPGTSTGSGVLTLTPGTYSIEANAMVQSMVNSSTTLATPGLVEWGVNIQEWNGLFQNTAFLPTVIIPGTFQFTDLPGNRWFDPIAASGFEFTMGSPETYFTEAGMPVGLGDGNNSYLLSFMDGLTPTTAAVAPGATFMFPANVSTFKVLDIDPTVDGEDPMAFPIFLDFSEATADFTMVAIPEPTSIAMLGFAALCGMVRRRRLS